MLSLAVRNLLRNRRRSLGTLLAVAIGASAVLMFGGYRLNLKYNMQTYHVRTGGHLQIQHRDFYLYGSGNPTAYGIDGYQELMAAVVADPALHKLIAVVSPMLNFGGIAGNYAAGVSRTVLGLGVQPQDMAEMRLWDEYRLQSAAPVPALLSSGPNGAIVGTGLARVLQLCDSLGLGGCAKPPEDKPAGGGSMPADLAQLAASDGLSGGEGAGAGKSTRAGTAAGAAAAAGANGKTNALARIELLASSPRGTPNVAQVEVVSAENQGIKELDDVALTVPLEQAQRLVYGRSPPKVTAIMIQLHSSSQVDAARERLEELLHTMRPKQPLSLLDYEQLSPFYVQAVRLFDTIFGFIFVLISGLVLFTVSNTMNTAVVERTVEVGTLRAIGLRRRSIQALFVTEGLLIGTAGALIGTFTAIVASALVNHSGLTWLPPGNSVRVPLVVLVWGETGMLFATVAGLIAVTVISAWYPARRASRLDIVEALRHA
jgi:putative ABC transport system permease protein